MNQPANISLFVRIKFFRLGIRHILLNTAEGERNRCCNRNISYKLLQVSLRRRNESQWGSNRRQGILRYIRRFCHKIILYLAHAILGGLDDNIVNIFKVCVKICRVCFAILPQKPYSHTAQTMINVTFKAFFHKLYFSCRMFFSLNTATIQPH